MIKIKTQNDLMLFIAELSSELKYFGNEPTLQAFTRVLMNWGFDPEDFEHSDI